MKTRLLKKLREKYRWVLYSEDGFKIFKEKESIHTRNHILGEIHRLKNKRDESKTVKKVKKKTNI